MIRSRSTVKVDAADRVFGSGEQAEVTWAVVDSGIDRTHPAFADEDGVSRVVLEIDVPQGLAAIANPADNYGELNDDKAWQNFLKAANVTNQPRDLRIGTDRDDHGTHVAGIIAAHARNVRAPHPNSPEAADLPRTVRGMHPSTRIVDLKVFDEFGEADDRTVMTALAFVRWFNYRPRLVEELGDVGPIDGVNLSISLAFDPRQSACGWSPVCQQTTKLVESGVVVVAAAGNYGFQKARGKILGAGFDLVSITDPGNTERAITVGATDSSEPHRYGPIGISSRGPTADGRHKPDLLAPGYAIVGPAVGGRWTALTGTSQAAAHVSGIAAKLIARFPEFRSRPDRVKRALLDGATDLERLPDYQGAGLVDALRTMQLL